MSDVILPMFLTILLLNVDVKSAVRVMGKGIFVLLIGTVGVIIGAPIAYFLVKHGLGPDAWQGFGALAGSWIGGTGNMAAVSEALGTSPTDFGLAMMADAAVYLIWLPIMLGSKNLAGWFHRFTGVSSSRLENLKEEAAKLRVSKEAPAMRHYLYLIFFGLLVTVLATAISRVMPTLPPFLTADAWRILLVTTFGIALSFTRARTIPGSHGLAMALVYLFVAKMGASAELDNIAGQAVWFLLGAYLWIFIHGGFILVAARIFKIDVHTAAIASAANIGGAASAPIVAAYHNDSLVPVSILMALIGYAIGNYGAFAAAWLCYLVS